MMVTFAYLEKFAKYCVEEKKLKEKALRELVYGMGITEGSLFVCILEQNHGVRVAI